MAGIIVKPRARIFHGHDWVFSGEIQKTFGDPKPGDIITMKDFKDRPLGTAIYNPNSMIVARRISRRKQELNLDFFQRRLRQAASYRTSVGFPEKLCRLVWSESDGLPGVILDRYDDHFVLQTLTLAMDLHRDILIEAIITEFQPKSIILRNDSPVRHAEGLEDFVAVVHGKSPAPFVVTTESGQQFEVNLSTGQKTGLYLDQIRNYAAVAKFANGKRVLDVFSNQGGFGIACALAGAASVDCIDISAEAVAAVSRNAQLNGVADRVNAIENNAFHFLKHCETPYDLIILDPPSFTRNRKSVNDALRGYKEIHLRGLKLLQTDGLLASFCCSHHITREAYLENLVDASVDAKRTPRLLANYDQSLDHPVLPGIPETEYLKGFLVSLIAAR